MKFVIKKRIQGWFKLYDGRFQNIQRKKNFKEMQF